MLKHLSVLLLTGIILSLPLLIFGFPLMGDAIFHYQWQASFTNQLQSGDLYPRWLLWSNRGFGSPDFVFYPPLPFYVGAFTQLLLGPDSFALRQLGASSAIALCLSGMFAFMWLRSYGTNTTACIGAILYMVFPYHLYVDLYVRGAYAEFWALTWLPLILFSARRVATRGDYVALLAASYALLAFTHLPTTLIFSPVAISYGLACCWWSNAGWRRAILVGASFALGVTLSAVYWFPAVTLKRFTVSITEGMLHYTQNFIPPIEGAGFSGQLHTVYIVALSMIAILAISIVTLMAGRSPDKENSVIDREIWFWSSMTLISLFMMTSLSSPIWKLLPVLQNIQFPWRFLVITTVSITPIATKAILVLSPRPLLVLAVVVTILLLALASGMPVNKSGYWDARARFLRVTTSVDEKQKALEEPWNTAGVYVFLPQWAANYRNQLVAMPNPKILESSASISITEWKGGNIQIQFNGKTPSRLVIGQFYFPGWQAHLGDGSAVALKPSPNSGLIMLDLPAGDGNLILNYGETPEMMYSRLISLITFGVSLTLLIFSAQARGLLLNKRTDHHSGT